MKKIVSGICLILFLGTFCFAQGGVEEELSNTKLMFEAVKAFSSGNHSEALELFSKVKPTSDKMRFDSGLGALYSKIALAKSALQEEKFEEGIPLIQETVNEIDKLLTNPLNFLPGGSEFFNSGASWMFTLNLLRQSLIVDVVHAFHLMADKEPSLDKKRDIYLSVVEWSKAANCHKDTLAHLGNILSVQILEKAVKEKDYPGGAKLIAERVEEMGEILLKEIPTLLLYFKQCEKAVKELPRISKISEAFSVALKRASVAKEIPSEMKQLIQMGEQMDKYLPDFIQILDLIFKKNTVNN